MEISQIGKVLHEPFNPETHVKTFINYCEVVIHKDGQIEYAVPSHDKKLLEIYAKQKGMTIDEAEDLMRKEHLFDYDDFMMHETGCIYVWYNQLYNTTNLTDEQHKSLALLLEYGCISDRCVLDVQSYLPYYSLYERRASLCK